MHIMNFRDMYQYNYNLQHLFAMNQKWGTRTSFTMSVPRKTSALIFFRNCSATYVFPDGNSLCVDQGTLVYLPQGSQYTTYFHNYTKDSIHTQLLEFELIDTEGTPFSAMNQVASIENAHIQNYPEIFDDLVNIYTSPFYSPSRMKSKVYELLYEISKSFHLDKIYSKPYLSIVKGILYLEHDTTCKLSIRDIAKMCSVDESCFRRLFKQYSGISPSEYRTQNLMRQAQTLLRSGDLTVSEIALRLGYDDVSYFSRVFKKKIGLSPSEYSKHILQN